MSEDGLNIREFVQYRIAKSEEAYEAARMLYDAGQFNAAINRLYYACFYVASALLLKRNIGAKSHAGVVGMFSANVVRTGEMELVDFHVYSKLLSWRTKGDYSDMFDFSKEDVDMVMVPARNFIDKVKRLI